MVQKQSCCRRQPTVAFFFALATGLFAFVELSRAETDGIYDAEGHLVSVNAAAFQPRSDAGDAPFTRYDGSLFGLKQANSFGPRDYYPPFFNGGGISSGDIDRDGWPDVASAAGAGIVIYMNQEGRRFVAREIQVAGMHDVAIFNVALVDLNGDGWLDLFATTYLHGNFYLLNNQKGEYTPTGLRQPTPGKAVLGSAVSFGDVDRNGDLDIVVGNWFAGASKKHPPPHSRNELWINAGDRFQVTPLIGLVGETLSMLLSDWSGDGWLDLIVGNDFDAPDIYYLGDRKGGFRLLERRDGIVPHSTKSTMSIDTADFDNDLDLDIFLDQITARATGPSARMQVLPMEHYCDDIVEETVRERCLANMAIRQHFFYGANHRPRNIRKCAEAPDKLDQRACVGMQVMMTAQRFRKPELCESIPKAETRTHSLCVNFFERVYPHDAAMLEQSIPQRMNQNVLLSWDASVGRFTDVTERTGVGFTGWSWNARFADVDNDEWQDLFIVSGSWLRATPSGTTANFFFHNEEGKQFTDQTDAFGFQNFMIVSAYTVVDFDRDGDLDFITNSVNGPLWLQRNNSRGGHSIAFQLRDEVGNRDGIGTKFTIHYGHGNGRHGNGRHGTGRRGNGRHGTGRRQMRELKASGGYLSFDEPLAHFGLGEYDRVERLEIGWSTGGTTVVPGPFQAGQLYSLKRSGTVSSLP
jgi:hypothetical protein